MKCTNDEHACVSCFINDPLNDRTLSRLCGAHEDHRGAQRFGDLSGMKCGVVHCNGGAVRVKLPQQSSASINGPERICTLHIRPYFEHLRQHVRSASISSSIQALGGFTAVIILLCCGLSRTRARVSQQTRNKRARDSIRRTSAHAT